jgi:D-alanyl-lipoteichoic acid acyltransferase DltB (MBOAT superfamily)
VTFTTPTFLVFLAVVYAAYWRLGLRNQNRLLLAASLVFYGWWDWRFLGLLLGTAGIDYLAALGMSHTGRPGARRALLLASLAANLGALGFFKYYGFFASSLRELLAGPGFRVHPWELELVLPVGISFYTFQALSYTIDVYRGRLAAVRDPLPYFCYIAFFPQLVAGPIERAQRLLPQFLRERGLEPASARDGLRQMLWGFLKKMVVADNLAPLVAEAYAPGSTASGWALAWATLGFAFQIYGDFSGYTDIAIGCARLFGFELMRNFDYPYFARSVPEFWRRWHISLATWFRDYLYLPLGGNRVSRWRWRLNVLAVFGVSGLWHGANWTFLAWGLLHGLYYLLAAPRPGAAPAGEADGRAPGPAGVASRVALTFLQVSVAWVFFRAESLGRALAILGSVATALVTRAPEPPPRALPFVWVGLLLGVEWLQRRRPHGLDLAHLAPPLRWATYYAAVAAILLFASVDYTPFIYFQF